MAKVKKKKAKAKSKEKAKKTTDQTRSLDWAQKAVETLQGQTKAASKYDTSNPFKFITGLGQIQGAMDKATQAAYDQKRTEAMQGLNAAEDSAYANTQEAIRGLRNSMAQSAASGANRGAAGANAVQALLGLGQQNNALTTQGLQNIQNVAGERAAQLAQNASDAIDKANSARSSQAGAANEKYTADQNYRSAAATALGGLSGSRHTDVYDYKMNQQTNKSNQKIAKTTQKTKNVNINKNS